MDQENCARVTRASAAKKRTAAAASFSEDQAPATKKRVVLGELPQLSNAIPSNPGSGIEPKKLKGKGKVQVKKAETLPTPSPPNDEKTNADANSELDDPQICSADVTDIVKYLRDLEVRNCFCNFLVMANG